MDAQISGGETRQDYKDPRGFPPVAPSCALLFLPFGLPVSFRCLWPRFLTPRLTLRSGKAVRSKLDCMHEPPVQSDCCVFSSNYHLESNPEKRVKTPMAAATGNRFAEQRSVEVLKCKADYGYTVKTNSVSVLCESQLPRFRNLPVNEPSKKPPCRVVFSFQSQEITF